MRRVIVGLLLSLMLSTTVATSALAMHTSWNVWTSSGGSTWNVTPIAGTGFSRAWARCVSSGSIVYGVWKTLNNNSSVNCGPQGFSTHGWQTTG